MKNKKSLKIKAIISLVIVSLGFSLMSIAARVMNKSFEPMTQVYLRIFFGFIIGMVVLKRDINYSKFKKISIKDWLILFLMGIVGYAIMVDLLTLGVIKSKLVNVAVISSTAPLFAYLYSIFIFKKKVKLNIFLLLGISMVGINMIATRSFIPTLTNFGIGELYVLLSMACLAWAFVGRKMLSNYLNNSEVTILMVFIATLSSYLFSLVGGETLNLSGFLDVATLIGLIFGSFANISVTWLENFAFQNIDSVLGSQILLSETLFSLILGIIIYKEYITMPEVAGAVLVVGSMYITNKLLE